jgi:fatty acid desaturase
VPQAIFIPKTVWGMKTVKFICTDKQQKAFSAALRKNVYAYFKEKGISIKGNTEMVIQTIIMLSIYIVPFILFLTVPMNIWFAMLMAVLTGIGMAGIGMCVMHDAVHGSYSNKPWVNKLLGGTIFCIILIPILRVTIRILHPGAPYVYQHIHRLKKSTAISTSMLFSFTG